MHGVHRAHQEYELQPAASDPPGGRIDSFECLRGFICGMYAGNYDISHVFVDNLCKVAHDTDERNVGAFLNWMEKFCAPLNLKITVTVSGDPGSATDTMRKYM